MFLLEKNFRKENCRKKQLTKTGGRQWADVTEKMDKK